MIEASNDVIPIHKVITMIQTNLNSNILYIHNHPESILSRLLKVVAIAIRQKSLVERNMNNGNFNQQPAPIPNSIAKKYEINTSEVKGRQVWQFRPRQNASDQVVLFFHGGAYIYNIATQYWQFISAVLASTKATFIVPDYPLAPQAQSEAVFEFISVVYKQVLATTPPHNITFMGDSAGAGLAFGFTHHLRDEKRPLPQHLILLSPFLDITMSNPQIPALEKQDKVLAAKGLRLAGKAYAGNLDHKDSRISPIYGNLNGLPKLSLFIGTHDLFQADSRKLKQKLQSANMPFNYFEYPKMMHDWMLVTALPESKHVIEQLSNLILRGTTTP